MCVCVCVCGGGVAEETRVLSIKLQINTNAVLGWIVRSLVTIQAGEIAVCFSFYMVLKERQFLVKLRSIKCHRQSDQH